MSASAPPLYPGFQPVQQGRPAVLGRQWMVSTTHYLATIAGQRLMEQGGNAIDAGVAAGLCINVLEPHLADFGGVAPIAVYIAETGEVATVSGLGRWPRKASTEWFQDRHGGDLPEGILRTVTPAAPDAWITALDRWGTRTFAEVSEPALQLARDGFPVWPELHRALKATQKTWAGWPGSAAMYLQRGCVPEVGELLTRPDLARTFERMRAAEAAAAGRHAGLLAARDLLYKGEIAREIARFFAEQEGLLTESDLAEFAVGVEPPERLTFGDYEVFSCGAWCQGPVLLQFLNNLRGLDLEAMGHNSPDYLHHLTEAMNLAFADRERYYGDPGFVDVPLAGLLAPAYGAAQRDRIDPARAFGEMPAAGDPWPYQGSRATGSLGDKVAMKAAPRTPDTSYLCAVDRWGNAMSATPSDFGLRTPVVPGLGFTVSPRGIQSWLDPQHPSRVEPGKRPRLTPNPALALKGGRLYMPFGCPGGDVQPQAMLQVFLNMTLFGMDPQQAIEQPRIATMSFPDSFWPHAYYPGLLHLEGRIPEATRADLARRGHKVEPWPDFTPQACGVCAIAVDPDKGTLAGGADPRRESYALGW